MHPNEAHPTRGAARSAVDRWSSTEPWSASWAATFRWSASSPKRSHGRPVVNPCPGPAVHGIGVRHWSRFHHWKSGSLRARRAGGSMISSVGMATSQHPDLLAVVHERRPADREQHHGRGSCDRIGVGDAGRRRRVGWHGATGRDSTGRSPAIGRARTSSPASQMASPYASAAHGACSSAQSNTMCRSAVSATARSASLANSSPTDIRPGTSSRIARNLPIRSGKSG